MNQFELSAALPTAPAMWKRETTNPVPLPPVREMNRLLADIRRARALLHAAVVPAEQAPLEHVFGNDPRD
jgi:hypothetical protein